ncbi:iron-containing alcohol dehydrogenase [Sporosarcina sp. P33]|uniref:iron-containing alcohol dehydrogenase n=1 Tax=Sporosarcina sp. P33 TaxID=1930764 RepID=UPI0009BD667B|nr:iron-containing alcohol dehydrogenase [Sporosarcina sp. P33]ARD49062.1 hypothetical protein SporoP33_13000 [Sporosarcina sp. P33]
MNQISVNIQDFRIPSNIKAGRNSFSTIHKDIEELAPQKIVLVSDQGLLKSGLIDEIKYELLVHGVPISTYTNISGEPYFETVKEAIDFMKQENADLVIGIGGGSALDVAKASAALVNKDEQVVQSILQGETAPSHRGIYCILVPTTSGTGSEVTMNAIFGDKKNSVKRGIVSPYYLPDIAIIDPALTVGCPSFVSAASGVDAFTHAIESYVSKKATPLTKIYAQDAMKRFSRNIAKVVFDGTNIEAREEMCWVSLLAGVSLANAGVGAVHALAYPLGGRYHVPHGVANALLLPYVFNVIGKTCINEMVEIADFLELGNFTTKPLEAQQAVVNYLFRLLDELDLPKNLKELEVTEESLKEMAFEASKVSRLLDNTPYKLTEESILQIYQHAYAGY